MPNAAVEPRSVSGHPVLDLVNTDVYAGGDPADDVLRSAGDFLDWAARNGLGPAEPVTSTPREERALRLDAVRLRASIRSAVEAIAAGTPVDPAALGPLQKIAADAMRHATPAWHDSRLTWEWNGLRAPLWRLASAAVELLHQTPPGRIKTCPGCGFLLLDTTKNGGRRWCSMDDCGTQEKMRRYVAKRAGRDPRRDTVGA